MAWTRWFKRKETVTTAAGRKRRVPDFADYGTAFGLDLSMTPETPPLRPTAAEAPPPKAIVPAVPAPAR
ncbi:hypothetical protein [Sphaerotilus mobilis]|nr:hypothetical protein [Sphaerotilus mobilis]